MSASVRTRLATMMFLQFFIWGAWFVTLSTYLGQGLGFSGTEIASAYSTMPWGAIVAPFLLGFIADRFFAAQRVLAILHLAGAALLWWASSVTDPTRLFWVLLGYALCYNPTLALVNAVAFAQMSEPARQFPAVRLFGTLGWIVAGIGVGVAGVEPTAIPLQLAAAASVALGLFAFFLPHTPPRGGDAKSTTRQALGIDAMRLFRQPSFAVFLLCSLLICIPLAFYYNFANLFLNEQGVQNAAGKMTLGQFSELLFMLVMPFFFARLGIKWMLLAGMLAWTARYVLFALGDPSGLMLAYYAAILLHGVCYDFFFVAGQIYVDRAAPAALRASAQGFITLITYGVGMLIGAAVSGQVVEMHEVRTGEAIVGHNWTAIWTVPAVMAAVVAGLFLLVFRENRSAAAAPQAADAARS